MNFVRLFLLLAALSFAAACGGSAGVSEQSAAEQSAIKFSDATERSGVKFRHVATRTQEKLPPEIMGSGLAVADFNRDGAPDLYLVNSGTLGGERRPDQSDKLFLGDGKGAFRDASEEWGVSGAGYGQGVAVGDFDSDGFPDIFLTSYEGDNRLLRNTGSKFEDISSAVGLAKDGKWSTSAGFFDADADGDLDLFLVRYIDVTPENHRKVYRNRMLVYTTPIYYDAFEDELFRNEGGKLVADKNAFENGFAANGLALAIADIDKDGDEDIYVANDTESNQLWINDGKAFKDIAQISGSAYSEIGQAEGSMGADVADFDSNGLLDIIVTNFQAEPNSLYSQESPLLFREVSDAVGIGSSSRQRLKFGIDFFDADNDGDEDVVVANGHIDDIIEKYKDSEKFGQPNSLYENLGNGKFRDITELAGNAFADEQVSRGLVTADLDGDGDLDFVITNNAGTAQVAFNETEKKGGFAIFWLEGTKANRSAIGARLVAKIGERTLERQVMGAQSYLSVSDFRVHFGLGNVQKIDELTIHWPGGGKQTLKDIGANKFYYVREGSDPREFVPGKFSER